MSENGMDRPCSRPASEHACVGQQKEHHAMPKSNTAVATIGIDPGKNTLHLVGLDARGGIVLREKVARPHSETTAPLVAPCIARHPCPTHGCPVTADGSHPRGSGSRLAPPRRSHRDCEWRNRSALQDHGALSAFDDDTRHRSDHLERRRRRNRQWSCFHTRPRFCCLARSGSQADIHG